jgi:urocanate hydratase
MFNRWIKEAHEAKLGYFIFNNYIFWFVYLKLKIFSTVVGSQARILYSDQSGRASISLAINKLVRENILKGPVVISRDHHVNNSKIYTFFKEINNL